MAVIDEIRIIYANFGAGVINARNKENGFKLAIEGIFTGKNLVDPYFETFFSKLTEEIKNFNGSEDEAAEIVKLIAEKSIEKKNDPKLGICYTAAYGPAAQLAKQIKGKKAEELYNLIDASFKSYECLPVMSELKKILKKNSKD